MHLTVLVDNTTLIDRYFLAEPGFAVHLQTGGKSILLDTGYSDVFVRNAAKLDVDLHGLDAVVLSHGHQDHTGGLGPLFQLFAEAGMEKSAQPRPEIVAHPEVFDSRFVGDGLEIGSLVSQQTAARFCPLRLSAGPVWLTERLVFLGEIPRVTGFESTAPVGRKRGCDGEEPCYVRDDTSLAYTSDAGLVIITGCAHAGICNTILHAQTVTGEQRIRAIIGGFHLQQPDERQLQGTMTFLETLHPDAVYAGHCTDLQSKIRLASAVTVQEVGVGLRLGW